MPDASLPMVERKHVLNLHGERVLLDNFIASARVFMQPKLHDTKILAVQHQDRVSDALDRHLRNSVAPCDERCANAGRRGSVTHLRMVIKGTWK